MASTMEKMKNAAEATSPFFRESDFREELEARGLKPAEAFMADARPKLRAAEQDYHRDSGKSRRILGR